MDPVELRAAFKAGRLAKADYIDAMFGAHSVLAAYASLLPGTDIAEITVVDGELRFRSRKDGLVLACAAADKRTAPFEILNFGSYEAGEAELLLGLVRPGWTVLDIGANVGWYSLCMAKRRPSARIHAFEPLPPTFAALSRNLELNALPNVTAHPFGFSEREEELEFFYDPQFSSRTSAADLAGDGSARRVKAKVLPLDAFAARKGLGKVDLIKCDVEGAELFVFRGAQALLARDRPAVFSEMLRKWSAKFGYRPDDLIALFRGLGYRCFGVRGGALRPVGAVDESTEETNFLFLHPEAHADLIRAHA